MHAAPRVVSVWQSKLRIALGAAPRPVAQGYPKYCHIRKADEISSVFDFKCRIVAGHFVAQGRPNAMDHGRLAILVNKKTARLSVQRNYMRRVVREQFRRTQTNLVGLDVVIRVVKAFKKQDHAIVCQEMSLIFDKIQKCHVS